MSKQTIDPIIIPVIIEVLVHPSSIKTDEMTVEAPEERVKVLEEKPGPKKRLKYNAWTEEEEALLKKLTEDPSTTLKDIEKQIPNHPIGSITQKMRVSRLRLKGAESKLKKWTKEEDDFLRQAKEASLSIEDITKVLPDRTYYAIKKHQQDLRDKGQL